MKKLEDYLITFFQVAIAFSIIGVGAMWAVDAWITEDNARAENLKRHFWDLAYSRVEGPAAPTGVRPHYTDKAEPKTKVFQEAQQGRR